MPLVDGIWEYEEGDILAPTYSEHLNRLGDSVRDRLAATTANDLPWTPVTPATGFTSFNAQVCRVNGEVRYRGYLQGALTTTAKEIGTVPAGFRAPGGAEDTASVVRLGSGAATTAVYLKGLSGYQATS